MRLSRMWRRGLSIAAVGVLAAVAGAQVVPTVPVPDVGQTVGGGQTLGGVGETVGRVGDSVGGTAGRIGDLVGTQHLQQAATPTLGRLTNQGWVGNASAATLADVRRERLSELVRSSRGTLEMAPSGHPVRRGQLVAIDPTPAQVQAAARAGFVVVGSGNEAALGLRLVTFASPRGLNAGAAQRRLAKAVSGLQFDFDHAYEPAGGPLAPIAGALAATQPGRGPLIGIVDGGVAAAPALARASIEQRGFSGPPQPTGHGTAVASLIVGADGRFFGAARGARLAAADVFGGNSAAGTATSIVRALSWLASKRPQVVNFSLVGPRSLLIDRAVAAMIARGIPIVAPVGNDGPAAPPLYPANQPGVIAVTGVDGRSRALREGGRSAQLAYAAPGADMAAALPGRGYAIVRGTSFAAPFVASRLALTGSVQRLNREVTRGQGRVGRGVICGQCRIAPKQVGAR